TIRRAPEWMQHVGLEWLFRLFQDPKRLIRRYLVTNLKFMYYLTMKKK
ncbi:MAG: WecB/TagA/CpsF family glycosyltransferase, partial [Lachnospiraceae bacterium]|nr:WecB/TagA/CpsF family glycosyltransferase [Lachnospiraceae bacterium]